MSDEREARVNLDQLIDQGCRRFLKRLSRGEPGVRRESEDAFALLDARLGRYHPRIVGSECVRTLAQLETCRVAGLLPDLHADVLDRRIASLLRGLVDARTTPTYVDPISPWTLGLAHDFMRHLRRPRRQPGPPGSGTESDADAGDAPALNEVMALLREQQASTCMQRLRGALKQLDVDAPRDFLARIAARGVEAPGDPQARASAASTELVRGVAEFLDFLGALSRSLGAMAAEGAVRPAAWCLASQDFGHDTAAVKLRSLVGFVASDESAARLPDAPGWLRMLDPATWTGSRSRATWANLALAAEGLVGP